MTCNDVSSNPSIETPQVTIFPKKKQAGHDHVAIIAGAAGGAILALLFISLAVFFYIKKKTTAVTYTSSMWKFALLRHIEVLYLILIAALFFRGSNRDSKLECSKSIFLQRDQSSHKQL